MLSFYPGVNNALRQRGFRPAFSVRKRLPPRVPLVAAGQSVATARFRSTSPEQLKRGAANRDRTVSRSCPAQKSKNFVSRTWSRSAALRGSFRLGPERALGRSPLRECQRRHAAPPTYGPGALAWATASATALAARTRKQEGGWTGNAWQLVFSTLSKERKNVERVCGDPLPPVAALLSTALPRRGQSPQSHRQRSRRSQRTRPAGEKAKDRHQGTAIPATCYTPAKCSA
jgi:hypothetical protein